MRRRTGRARIRSWSALIALALAALLLFVHERWGGPDGPGPVELAAEPGMTVPAEVVRVVDGDTVVARIEGGEQRVRYIGIDTPESVQPGQPVECFGPESAARNRQLVEGRQVELEIGSEPRDRYDRLLAYVRLGGLMVNAELIRDGFARSLEIPPNDLYADQFSALESRAQSRQIGLWERC